MRMQGLRQNRTTGDRGLMPELSPECVLALSSYIHVLEFRSPGCCSPEITYYNSRGSTEKSTAVPRCLLLSNPQWPCNSVASLMLKRPCMRRASNTCCRLKKLRPVRLRNTMYLSAFNALCKFFINLGCVRHFSNIKPLCETRSSGEKP